MRATVRARLGWKAIPLWLKLHPMELGVSLGIVVIVTLAWLVAPTGRARLVEGEIIGFSLRTMRKSVVRVASVVVDGRTVTVPAPITLDCQAGDRVWLTRSEPRWRHAYEVALAPHPCHRP